MTIDIFAYYLGICTIIVACIGIISFVIYLSVTVFYHRVFWNYIHDIRRGALYYYAHKQNAAGITNFLALYLGRAPAEDRKAMLEDIMHELGRVYNVSPKTSRTHLRTAKATEQPKMKMPIGGGNNMEEDTEQVKPPKLFSEFTNIDWTKIWEVITTEGRYKVDCDDGESTMTIVMSWDGDMHLSMSRTDHALMPGDTLTFRARTHGGGSRNTKIREALLLLVLAIQEGDTP